MRTENNQYFNNNSSPFEIAGNLGEIVLAHYWCIRASQFAFPEERKYGICKLFAA